MAVLNLISSQKVPARTGPPQAEVYQLWVENPAGLRMETYGTRIPQQVLPHDHGSRRGQNLEFPILQVSFGPQATPGAGVGNWLAGVPLYPGSGVDFAEEPKLIWAERLDMQGGVNEVFIEILYDYGGGAGTLEILCCLRPLAEHGLNPDEGDTPVHTLVHTLTGASRVTRNAVQFSDLSDFGPSTYDRPVMVEVWLSADPTAVNFRLLACAAIPGEPDTANPFGEPLEFKPPRVAIDPTSLQTGKIAQSEIAQAAHVVWNQLGQEVLGGTPGVKADGTPDRSAPFVREIWRRHRHTGRRFTDPETGEVASDGAIPLLPLAQESCVTDLDDNALNILSTDPAKGYLLHPTDTLDTSQGWLQREQRIETPIGCPELWMQARISFAHTTQMCRLWWYVALHNLNGNLLDFDWVGGGLVIDPARSGVFARALVEPIDGIAWQQNAVRLGNGVGLWTQKAAAHPLPTGVRTTTNLPRITKVMRLTYTPTQTGPIRITHAWGLEIGAEGSANYDNLARLAGVKVWCAPGY